MFYFIEFTKTYNTHIHEYKHSMANLFILIKCQSMIMALLNCKHTKLNRNFNVTYQNASQIYYILTASLFYILIECFSQIYIPINQTSLCLLKIVKGASYPAV